MLASQVADLEGEIPGEVPFNIIMSLSMRMRGLMAAKSE
jgi:hypothetical protein